MFQMPYKLLLAALFLLIAGNGATGLQSPVAQNYTNSVLRIAKAAQIKAFLNVDKNPCENFYKFACGKWKRVYPATERNNKTTYLDQLQDLYVSKSAEMLKADRKIDNTVDVKLKDFYESCRNADALKAVGLEPVLRLVNFQGGWPQVTSNSWYEYEYDWLNTVSELRRKLGVDILVGLEVVPDFEDKDTHRIKVGAPELDLKYKVAYLDEDYDDLREDYKKNIASKLRRHFKNMPSVWADEVADQVLRVETELAKGLPDNARLSMKQTSRIRYATELKAAYGNFVDLSRYLNIIFNQTIYVQVYETPEDYMSNLVEVIKHTPKLTLANYTMWRVLSKLDFDGEINNEHNDNWCVHKIIDYFPHQLESMFHRNYNNMQLNNELKSVWADIKRTFRQDLQTSPRLNWITLDTRQKAVLKLDAMDLEIMTHDDEHFDEQMRSLHLRKEKYYQNLISIMEWRTQFDLSRLIEKPKTVEPEPRVPKYEITTNKIRIPSTFLQSRFFWDPAYPTALKYSTLGFLLAQQMIHGFDTNGHKYDKYGHQRNWWDSVSEYAFDERAKCFAKQYIGYDYDDKDVIDPNVLSTVIADNGALGIAYRAYLTWRKNIDANDVATQETLPILLYTKYQTFFIGFAQLMCADYHESVKTYPELPPERYRVIGALSNSNDFARDFKCQLGSKMNPEKKCSIY